jgi:DNA-binding CsgD family transcriptional regulator
MLEPLLVRGGIGRAETFRHGVARILLDYPQTWVLPQLKNMNSFERSHTIVCTQSSHEAYFDCLASFHISGVVNMINENGVIGGIHSAAAAQRFYQYRSGLTYMEMRVTRLLLAGNCTAKTAAQLSITAKTVNAHISNILLKFGYESRAQYIAILLGDGSSRADTTAA